MVTCQGQTFDVPEIVCSTNFLFNGTCDGTDQVKHWKIDGKFAPKDDWRIFNWEPDPILIIQISLNQVSGGHHVFWMTGNSYTPDIMSVMGRDQDSITTDLRPGMRLDTNYIDLHGACYGNDPVQVWMTIWYEPTGKPK